MIPKPWQIDSDVYAEIPEYYPDYPFDDVVTTYKNFYHNSYLVPCVAILVIYGLVLLFVVASAIKQVVRLFWPRFGDIRWLKAHATEHALVKRRYAELVSLPGLRWLTLQLPLHGDCIVLLLILLANFLPLVAFYEWYLDDNVFWTGPTGKRDMLCRFLADRTALLATSCFPLLILFASKRTPLAILAHLEMTTLMLYHRWIARICWAHVVIHTTAFSVDYARGGYLAESFKEPYFQWGCVGFGMMCGLVFFSLRALREKWYELFVFLHVTMAVVAIVGVYLHIKLLASPQMFVLMTELSAAFWAFDRVVRLATRLYFSMSWTKGSKTPHCTVAHVQTVGTRYLCLRIELPLSRLRFQTSAADQTNRLRDAMLKIGAGDDIRITVPRVQLVGEHPFTVLRTGRLDDGAMGYVDLLIKTYGGLTRKLALRTNTVMLNRSGEVSARDNTSVKVLVEGPFGSIPSLASADNAVLVAGGIAITYCWPLFTAAARSVYPLLQTCKLVWIVRQSDTVDVIEEALSDLVCELESRDGANKVDCQLMLDIYVTESAGNIDGVDKSDEKHGGSHEIVHALPTLSQGTADTIRSSSSSSEHLDSPKQAMTAGTAVSKLQTLATRSGLIQVQCFKGRPASISLLHEHVSPSNSEKIAGSTADLSVDERRDEIHFAACGPASLCDAVRAEAIDLMHQKRRVRIDQDCFSY